MWLIAGYFHLCSRPALASAIFDAVPSLQLLQSSCQEAGNRGQGSWDEVRLLLLLLLGQQRASVQGPCTCIALQLLPRLHMRMTSDGMYNTRVTTGCASSLVV